MRIPKSLIRISALLAVGVFPVLAQDVADVGRLQFDALPSPEVNTGKNKSFKPKDWLEMEFPMTVPAQNRIQEESGFIDQLTVKWYVAAKDKSSGRTVLLTKTINHVNIPVGEEAYSSIYISPNTLKRLTGSDRADRGVLEAIGVEILVDGTKVGQASEGQNAGWWNSPSLARGDSFPLLNKLETPFKMLWWDRYAEIEEQR